MWRMLKNHFKQALQANRDSYVSMLELSEIFYLNQQFPAATQMYEQFVRAVGQKKSGCACTLDWHSNSACQWRQFGYASTGQPVTCFVPRKS